MSRRKSRVLAFQTLYAYEAGGMALQDLLRFQWVGANGVAAENANKEDYVFARLLASGAVEHLYEIDSLIKKYLAANWDFSRLNRVSLAILRVGSYEILYVKDKSPQIVIDEAIHIAKEYGEYESYKFINAMLDKICVEAEAKQKTAGGTQQPKKKIAASDN